MTSSLPCTSQSHQSAVAGPFVQSLPASIVQLPLAFLSVSGIRSNVSLILPCPLHKPSTTLPYMFILKKCMCVDALLCQLEPLLVIHLLYQKDDTIPLALVTSFLCCEFIRLK